MFSSNSIHITKQLTKKEKTSFGIYFTPKNIVDYVMDNEYQGVKSEYVKYDKPIFVKSKTPVNKKITTLKEAKDNPAFVKVEGVDFMQMIKDKKLNK